MSASWAERCAATSLRTTGWGVSAVALAVTAVTGCGAEGRSGDGEAEQPGARAERLEVLFTVRGDGANDLYVETADGTLVHLTPDSEGDNWGVWSPDGSAIAFQARRDGNTELYMMDADGGDPRNLSNDPAHDGLPVWSPDGASIAFFSSRGLEVSETGLPGHIYVIGVDGDPDEPVRITGRPLESTLGPSSWSADGRHLYFTRLTDTGSRLMRVEVETGQEEALYESAGYMGGGVLSPDGASLATYLDDGSQSRIGILRLGDVEPRLELFSPKGSHHYYPRWSPDGARILYTAQTAAGSYDIEAVDLESGATEKVLSSPRSELEASWRPVR